MASGNLRIHKWRTKSFGRIENLELVEEELPLPKSNEVRISVRAIGLNFADVFAVLGLYKAAGSPPFTPGFEVAGVIESVGEQVSGFKVGERVVALIRFGGYATGVNIRQRYVRKLNEDWTFAEGAAFTVQALTAYYAIVILGGLMPKGWSRRKGEVFFGEGGGDVLIHSVAGGVGLIAGEIVQKCGGRVVGTVGREQKLETVKNRLLLPRERIVVREKDSGDFQELISEKALGQTQPFDLVLDSVAGKYFEPSYKSLKVGGKYVIFGIASMMPHKDLTVTSVFSWLKLGWQMLFRPKLDPLMMISQNKTISGFNLVWLFEQDEVVQLWDEIIDLKLSKPLVGREYDFAKAKDALTFFQSGCSVGKVCLIVPEDLQL